MTNTERIAMRNFALVQAMREPSGCTANAERLGRTVALESMLRILLQHRRCPETRLAVRQVIRATIRRIRNLRSEP